MKVKNLINTWIVNKLNTNGMLLYRNMIKEEPWKCRAFVMLCFLSRLMYWPISIRKVYWILKRQQRFSLLFEVASRPMPSNFQWLGEAISYQYTLWRASPPHTGSVFQSREVTITFTGGTLVLQFLHEYQ